MSAECRRIRKAHCTVHTMVKIGQSNDIVRNFERVPLVPVPPEIWPWIRKPRLVLLLICWQLRDAVLDGFVAEFEDPLSMHAS